MLIARVWMLVCCFHPQRCFAWSLIQSACYRWPLLSSGSCAERTASWRHHLLLKGWVTLHYSSVSWFACVEIEGTVLPLLVKYSVEISKLPVVYVSCVGVVSCPDCLLGQVSAPPATLTRIRGQGEAGWMDGQAFLLFRLVNYLLITNKSKKVNCC